MAPKAYAFIPACPWRAVSLLMADCLALYGTFFLALLARKMTGGSIFLQDYLHLVPFLLVMPLYCFFRGLYGLTLIVRHEEFSTVAIGTSMAYLCMLCGLFLMQNSASVSRTVIALGWLGSFVTVPLARGLSRRLFVHKSWWATPAVLFGDGGRAVQVMEQLRRTPSIGIRPVAFMGKNIPPDSSMLEVLDTEEQLRAVLARYYGHACAILTLDPADDANQVQKRLVELTRWFHDVIYLPGWYSEGMVPFNFSSVAMGEFFGLKMVQKLLDPRRMLLKRCLDVMCAGLGMLCLSPLVGLVCLCIVIESPGNPFYRQKRVGRGGKPLYVLKFRTMVPHADDYLKDVLEHDARLRAEWEADQKFRDDPRVTRVGKFLRRSSLDELPQLWNVLKGEMSLVGPRPIVESEIERYGDAYELYTRVRPGITGLWQVSGRNDVRYAVRVRLDQYYIHNWSLWLDLYILAKTIPAVLCSRGAY